MAQVSGAALRIEGVSKRYGHTQALDGVTVSARRGEITGIVGANGAGKSTLMKVLAGEVAADAGTIFLDGVAFDPMARERVAIVHQEPFVYPNLTVAENVSIGRESMHRGRPVLGDREREVAARFHIGERHLHTDLGDLPVSFRQRTEIVRAVLAEADIFLFDEPNSALGPDDSEQLLGAMQSIAAEGKVVFLISHRLAEVERVAHRVVVMRNGQDHEVLDGADIAADRMAVSMLARSDEVPMAARGESASAGATVVQLGVPRAPAVDPAVLTLAAGEVVAIVGLEGSGARELTGSIVRQHERTRDSGPAAYVVGDRKQSLVQTMSVSDNLVMRCSGRFRTRLRMFDRRAAARFAREAVDRFAVKCSSIDSEVSSLSGGNQQKVAIAASLAIDPALVVVEEPTRGIDLGSRRQIHQFLREHAASGRCVVFFSSEEIEVPELADRVIVMRDGEVAAHLRVADFDGPEEMAQVLVTTQSGATAGPRPA